MDEPLAHLDAKLRHHMRAELKEIQYSLNTTTIYVTHDYMEALSLGDRIAVINEGNIIQIGSRDEIYYTPCNEFVAKLVGEPEINIFKCEICGNKIKMFHHENGFALEEDVIQVLKKERITEVDLGIRANNISYSFKEPLDDSLCGRVYSFEPIGNKAILIVQINGELIRTVAPIDLPVNINDRIYIKFDLKNALFFNVETKNFITRHNQAMLKGR